MKAQRLLSLAYNIITIRSYFNIAYIVVDNMKYIITIIALLHTGMCPRTRVYLYHEHTSGNA